MKLILIFAQAITQQEQIIGFFMKQFICFFSGLLLLFVSTTRVVAQEVSDYSQLSEEDYSKIVLPPLSVLFENAKNSPIYEMADVKATIERKLLKKKNGHFWVSSVYEGAINTECSVMSPPIRTWQSPHILPIPPRHKTVTQ